MKALTVQRFEAAKGKIQDLEEVQILMNFGALPRRRKKGSEARD